LEYLKNYYNKNFNEYLKQVNLTMNKNRPDAKELMDIALNGFDNPPKYKEFSIFKPEDHQFVNNVLNINNSKKLKIDIDSYSPKDLKNGIFKSMTLTGEEIVINDIYLSTLNLKSLCKFNYIKPVKDDVVFKEAFPMSFDLSVTESDLNKTIQNSKYQKIIKDLNNIGKNYAGGLQIASTRAAIKNNKFYYILGFDIPFVRNEQKLVVQADLKIKNGKIEYCNTRIASGHFNMDLKNVDFIMNYLNPLDFSVNILQNKDAKVTVKEINMVDNTLNASGIIVIPKD